MRTNPGRGLARQAARLASRSALGAVVALALLTPAWAGQAKAGLSAEDLDQAAESSYRYRLVHAMTAMGKHLALLSQSNADMPAAAAAARPLPGLVFTGQQWTLSASSAREVSACLRVPVSGASARRALVGAAAATSSVVRDAAGGPILGFQPSSPEGETYSLCKSFDLDRVWLGASSGASLFLGPSGSALLTVLNPGAVTTGPLTVETSAGFQAVHDCANGVSPRSSCAIELRRAAADSTLAPARDIRGPGLIGRVRVYEGSKQYQRSVSERRISADPAATSSAELSLD